MSWNIINNTVKELPGINKYIHMQIGISLFRTCTCSHLSAMLWHLSRLFPWVLDLRPTLHSHSQLWSCSWSLAPSRKPTRLLMTDQSSWEQNGRCYRILCTSCHHQSTLCNWGCRWCLLCLRCLWVVPTPRWRRFHSQLRWDSQEQMEDLREYKGSDQFLYLFTIHYLFITFF